LLLAHYGWFKTVMNDNSIGITLKLHISHQNVNGRLLPLVRLNDFNIAVDTRKITIYLGGSCLMKIASIFTGLFKGPIIRAIVSTINYNLPIVVNNVLQQGLVYSNGLMPLFRGYAFDF
jgi:hypothetical protein